MTDQTPEALEPDAVIEPLRVSSGVAFPDEAPEADVSVAARFLRSGNQIQMALIGAEPAILVQPEYDADENEITFVTTVVDLDPQGFVEVLEILMDAAKQVVEQQEAAKAEAEHDHEEAQQAAEEAVGDDA